MIQGGVDPVECRDEDMTCVGRTDAQWLELTERGLECPRGAGLFGFVAPSGKSVEARPNRLGCELAAKEGSRWLHTRASSASSAKTTPEVAKEAMVLRRKSRAPSIRYDLKTYRDSLWKVVGGKAGPPKWIASLHRSRRMSARRGLYAALGILRSKLLAKNCELDRARFPQNDLKSVADCP